MNYKNVNLLQEQQQEMSTTGTIQYFQNEMVSDVLGLIDPFKHKQQEKKTKTKQREGNMFLTRLSKKCNLMSTRLN